jgi:hypothetical protein
MEGSNHQSSRKTLQTSISLRRVTEGWGQAVEAQRQTEAEQVYVAEVPQPVSHVVRVHKPIRGLANISSDVGMVFLRKEGWKEVKISVISEVKPKMVQTTNQAVSPETRILLSRHSYQAGLWSANEMGQHQYLEGARRQVNLCPGLTSVNDGAPWIDRITTSNYPQAVQIIDWSHAKERLRKVATPALAGGAREAAFGEASLPTQQWIETQAELLWHGRINEVVSALHAPDWNHISCLDDVLQSLTDFESRQSKMEYALFRQAGYPIGSGIVESGINTVVHHRITRQGRGWERKQAQAMLAALSEFHSGRFQSAWQAVST